MAKEHKRNKKVCARFTEDEYKIIEEMEQTLGMRKTDLVRSRLLNSGAVLTVDAKTLMNELNAIGSELGRSGNNINQLARHANTLNKRGMLAPAIIDNFNALFSSYLEHHVKLELTLRKILRSMIGWYIHDYKDT